MAIRSPRQNSRPRCASRALKWSAAALKAILDREQCEESVDEERVTKRTAAELEARTLELAQRIAGVPSSHLAMHKLVVNQAMLTMGLEQTQMFATVFDGITRHSPEGLWFKRYAEAHGFQAAAEWRDSGGPLPEPPPGSLGDEFMAAPPARGLA